MFINTTLIFSWIQKRIPEASLNLIQNTSFCSFRFYDDSPLFERHLYLISPEQFAILPSVTEEVAFLSLGFLPDNLVPPGKDLIQVPDTLSPGFLINHLNAAFDYYQDWDNQLNQFEISITGIQEMLEHSRSVLSGSLILVDYHFHYLAYTKDFEKAVLKINRQYSGQIPPYISEELLTNPDYIQVQNSHDIFEYPIHNGETTIPALCLNLFRDGENEYLARILFSADQTPFTDDQRYLLRYLGEKIKKIFQKCSLPALSASAYAGLREAIEAGIQGKLPSSPMLSSVFKSIHWSIADRFQLIKLVPYFFNSSREINAVATGQVELLLPHSCAVLTEKSIVLLVNLTKSEKKRSLNIQETLSPFLREHLYKAGASMEFNDFANIASAFAEAGAALKLGNSRDSTFWFFRFCDYSLEYMLERCQDEIHKENLCHPGLLKLLRYDKEHNTRLFHALEVFMNSKYNVSHAADQLFIHRTTLLKHLSKIYEISGIDLDDWHTRLHLMLSFQLLK